MYGNTITDKWLLTVANKYGTIMKPIDYFKYKVESGEMTAEEAIKQVFDLSDDSDFIEHHLEDDYGYKFYIKLPSDVKDITVINDENDNIIVGFKTKFDGKKYLQTYIKV